MRVINVAGLNLIKSFEGFRAKPYQDSAGVWTIGYGHTRGVSEAYPEITIEQAEDLLASDLTAAESAVEHFIHVPLNENQYAALVSLVFNAGTGPLLKSLGKFLNGKSYGAAAEEFAKWRIAGGTVSDGLVRRRAAERKLFLTPVEISGA